MLKKNHKISEIQYLFEQAGMSLVPMSVSVLLFNICSGDICKIKLISVFMGLKPSHRKKS